MPVPAAVAMGPPPLPQSSGRLGPATSAPDAAHLGSFSPARNLMCLDSWSFSCGICEFFQISVAQSLTLGPLPSAHSSARPGVSSLALGVARTGSSSSLRVLKPPGPSSLTLGLLRLAFLTSVAGAGNLDASSTARTLQRFGLPALVFGSHFLDSFMLTRAFLHAGLLLSVFGKLRSGPVTFISGLGHPGLSPLLQSLAWLDVAVPASDSATPGAPLPLRGTSSSGSAVPVLGTRLEPSVLVLDLLHLELLMPLRSSN